MESQESSLSLEKYWQVLKRRWVPGLAVFFPVFLLSLLSSSLKKPTYIAEGKLLFQRTDVTSSLTGLGTEISKLESVGQDTTSSPLQTEAEIIRSVPVVQKTIKRLKLQDNNGNLLKYEDFLKNLTVSDIKKTDVLQVSYKDSEPQKAARVVNTLMSAYLEHNVSSRRKAAKAAREFIEQQLPKAEAIVSKAEAELANFREKNNVFALQEEASKSIESLRNLQSQIGDIKTKLADISARSQQIRQQLNANPQQALDITSLNQAGGVQDILKEVQQVESQLASRRTVLTDTHPEIIALENKFNALKRLLQNRIRQTVGTNGQNIDGIDGRLQVGDLKQQLASELVNLESTSLGLNNQLAVLSELQTSYKQRLENLPKLEQQQRQLERKIEAAQSTYSLLLKKLQEARIAENQNIGNASEVSEALVPQEPVSSPLLNYLSASLLGMLVSLATMYLLESQDKSIKTIEEAKELTGLTLLGVIPDFSKPKKSILSKQEVEAAYPTLMVRDAPRSPISEAFRMLRANLKFMSADKELKVIVVTSSVPQEGKSTVAANLATSMAQMERRVLLIDGDLHRPCQHHIWELPNSEGLSNVIVGQIEVMRAIKKGMDNLDVLTCGAVPPSPASLLDSKRMASLIDSFRSYYDYVIIDAPSLNLAADAATLGQMADGVLLVVRPGVVDSVNAAFACEMLEKSGQNVLGQVVNGVVQKNERHMNYYYKEEYPEEKVTTVEALRL
ncbi:polysaccharide biosynthesis tyrosine autokinase [Plectonema cf. radiosum LEGE 06105]|uniref:non-specific protein-tyrosine kinase n=1 Tax=Plectonema cf. radiosum LEGE 06105 TaxID=945769 RepID=A0A8J7K175_9CYAN|nr:polysaccharide biosynthesis tyrosine autokinase [Plectonema radiosum]MBE9214546.1 polysaccharide biosynthesis tyrosine autokinase [Plectonema cf. radiosum LEGE 06105]